MKKVLIATNNKEKYAIVSFMFQSLAKFEISLLSLSDLSIKISGEEFGDLSTRAKKKVHELMLAYNDYSKFDIVVGVDDGIRLFGESINPNVKDFLKTNNNLNIGDRVEICRSIYFYIPKCKKYVEHFHSIPFEYIGLQNSNSSCYPLSLMLAPIGSKVPIGNYDANTANEYYLYYCGDDLEKKLDVIGGMINVK